MMGHWSPNVASSAQVGQKKHPGKLPVCDLAWPRPTKHYGRRQGVKCQVWGARALCKYEWLIFSKALHSVLAPLIPWPKLAGPPRSDVVCPLCCRPGQLRPGEASLSSFQTPAHVQSASRKNITVPLTAWLWSSM
jgi:hypothetical protein